jgi:beta-glucosidase
MLTKAADKTQTARFSTILLGDDSKQQSVLLAAHTAGARAIKSAGFGFPVGLSLAISDDQAVGPESRRDQRRERVYGAWLDAAKQNDDFVGVQVYTRTRLDRNGMLRPEPGVELTDMGYEFWPEAVGEAIRYAYQQTGKPIYVTENGVATNDDARRLIYIDRALASVQKCLKDGIPVNAYLHWSLLDNFEWLSGYRPKFGLAVVDRATQKRTPKASAIHLGQIARQNGLI